MMAASSGAPKREVAESSFDLLHHSIVETFCSASRGHSSEEELDQIGFQVGSKLAERYSKDRAPFASDLEVITFLCKEFWTEVYGKQMDRLRTNHNGVFELQDHRFRSILRLSAAPEQHAGEAAKRFLAMPSGMVRGALSALGIVATVRAEVNPGLPSIVFVVHVKERVRPLPLQ